MSDGSIDAMIDSIMAASGAEGYGGPGGSPSELEWENAGRVPELTGRVVDLADIVSPSTEAVLTARLAAFEDSTGHQIAVLTVPSLRGEVLEPYATDVFRAWGLGDAEANNGVLLLIARDDRKIRIEVGYGLEGEIPDALAARIIRNEMTPRFRDGDFGGGITAAAEALMGATQGTYVAPQSEIGLPELPVGESVFTLSLLLPLWYRFARFGAATLGDRVGMAFFGWVLSLFVALVAGVLIESFVPFILTVPAALVFVALDTAMETIDGPRRAVRRRALDIATVRSARIRREKDVLFKAARKRGDDTVVYEGRVLRVPPVQTASSSSGSSSSWSSSSTSSSFSGGGGSSGGGGASGGW